MPIIINEFELIPAPPVEAESPELPRTEAPTAEPLRPEDVERVLERRQLRLARLWAD